MSGAEQRSGEKLPKNSLGLDIPKGVAITGIAIFLAVWGGKHIIDKKRKNEPTGQPNRPTRRRQK